MLSTGATFKISAQITCITGERVGGRRRKKKRHIPSPAEERGGRKKKKESKRRREELNTHTDTNKIPTRTK